MGIIDFNGKSPVTHEKCFIAEGCRIIGDVTIDEDSSVWFNSIVRGDVCSIRIGKKTNIQDSSVLHGDTGTGLTIGDGVTVGHRAILHGCIIGNDTLIGMGAIILDGSVIGSNCIIGAGALITSNTVIPDGSLVLGMPGSIKRQLNESEIESVRQNAQRYVSLKESYK